MHWDELLGKVAATIVILAVTGCGDDETGKPASTPPALSYPTLECDPLDPNYCGFPFPNNVFTRADETSKTGRRVELSSNTLPIAQNGNHSAPDPFNTRDGFSPGSAMLVHFPDLVDTGLPGPLEPDASLADDCPTVILDAETGERVAHFAEIDRSRDDDTQRSLILRLHVRLKDAHRYIVALRHLQTENGPLAPSPAFLALRDDQSSDEPSVAERRGLYADIFSHLEKAGIQRADLQLAWDFTTASRENTTGWLLAMRDDSLAAAGDTGPAYVIDKVEDDWNTDHILYRVTGHFTVPLYLTDPKPGGHLVFDANGRPTPNESQPTLEVPFELLIPQSAKNKPAKLLQYAHGLLGSHTQIEAGNFRNFCDQYGYAIFGVDLIGMSEDDSSFIIEGLSSGKLENLAPMFERMHQGTLNNLMAMRMVMNGLSKDATLGKYLDPSERYYHGISQGGIFGGVYMALTTDVQRGVLGVMGQPYGLLLNRSVDFAPFFVFMGFSFPDARDQQMLLDLVQMVWDRTEPDGYSKYIENDPLPGTPSHTVLMRAAVGDHQVTNLGAHVMARAVGAKHLTSGLNDVWGLEAAAGPFEGSAFVEYDFGLPPMWLCDKPFDACGDPHGKLRDLPEADQQMDQFLRTGTAQNFCAGGKCSHPELSGCDPQKPPANPCEQ